MFSPEEIAKIDSLLREGVTPERIAEELGLNYSTFRLRLVNSGYRVATKRELERVVAVEPAIVTVAA